VIPDNICSECSDILVMKTEVDPSRHGIAHLMKYMTTSIIPTIEK